jgi:hypothetical protein
MLGFEQILLSLLVLALLFSPDGTFVSISLTFTARRGCFIKDFPRLNPVQYLFWSKICTILQGEVIFCWEYKHKPYASAQSVAGLGSSVSDKIGKAVLIHNPLSPFANTTNLRILISLCSFPPDNLADHCLVLLINGLCLFTPCSHLLFIYYHRSDYINKW